MIFFGFLRLFMASVRSQPSGPPLVPGVLFNVILSITLFLICTILKQKKFGQIHMLSNALWAAVRFRPSHWVTQIHRHWSSLYYIVHVFFIIITDDSLFEIKLHLFISSFYFVFMLEKKTSWINLQSTSHSSLIPNLGQSLLHQRNPHNTNTS